MVWKQAIFRFLLVVALASGLRGVGFDTNIFGGGLDEFSHLLPESGRWTPLRLKMFEGANVFVRTDCGEEALFSGPAPLHDVAGLREILGRIRAKGYRVVAVVRYGSHQWRTRPRTPGLNNSLPSDLREVRLRMRRLAETYGDLVDVWEIQNEPDLHFVGDLADSMAAYFKASALGVVEGRSAGLAAGTGFAKENGVATRQRAESLVLMPASGLPPGPNFTQLLENGLLNYTEGFNYHYYGFGCDYAGVYAQYLDAVGVNRGYSRQGSRGKYPAAVARERSRINPALASFRPRVRTLPVFVTEWGYSLLDGVAAQEVKGRLAQWRFCVEVAGENERLGIVSPLAFSLRPYFEQKLKEFGLLMPFAGESGSHYGFFLPPAANNGGLVPSRVEESAWGERGGATNDKFSAGGLVFCPTDFSDHRGSEWMRRIGEKWGGLGEVSPALAWLLAENESQGSATESAKGGDAWRVHVEQPSPVVIDFLAGPEVVPVKGFQGYWVRGDLPPSGAAGLGRGRLAEVTATADVVVYNFERQPVGIRLHWPSGLRPVDGGLGRVYLNPGERLVIPVVLSISSTVFRSKMLRLTGVVNCGAEVTVSRWAARFYPSVPGMEELAMRDFAFPQSDAEENRTKLCARFHAAEEPTLTASGRWLVTDGVSVEETEWGWRFHIRHFPGIGLRPAVAELPLPRDWRLLAHEMLVYDYRILRDADALPLSEGAADPRLRRQTGIYSSMMESYVRGVNGNLYSTFPRLLPTGEWRRYNQSGDTFTMHFLGRTEAPWQFVEAKAASLVFFMRPDHLPAVVEIRSPRISLMGLPDDKD